MLITREQTYSATVRSVLPVLLSAVRISPPADGPPHGGKVIGRDVETYTYEQASPGSPHSASHALNTSYVDPHIDCPDPFVPHRDCRRERRLPRIRQSAREELDEWDMGRA